MRLFLFSLISGKCNQLPYHEGKQIQYENSSSFHTLAGQPAMINLMLTCFVMCNCVQSLKACVTDTDSALVPKFLQYSHTRQYTLLESTSRSEIQPISFTAITQIKHIHHAKQEASTQTLSYAISQPQRYNHERKAHILTATLLPSPSLFSSVTNQKTQTPSNSICS